MLQDLSYGTLDNPFRNLAPTPSDRVLCFRSGGILISRKGCDDFSFPEYDWACKLFSERAFVYGFTMQSIRYFLCLEEAPDLPESGFTWENVRLLRGNGSKDLCFAAFTGWHLYKWYRANRFCGCCGQPTRHDTVERMLRCESCGNVIYPRINPAVIVAVTDGDRLLLTKYAGRSYTRYALVAGFTEIGETLEQTVAREVMEEVGLRVKNIRYYKSQPWGIDGNILMGFYCDLDGDDTIHLDEKELSVGQWHPRHALPAKDDGVSLTREMIRVFEEGREPK